MAEMKTEEIWEFEKKPRLEKEIEIGRAHV